MRPYSPGGELNALAPTPRGYPPSVQFSSFTAWTTRVSNPVCSPRFRSSASVLTQTAAFAIGVLPDLYAFHRYTGIPRSSVTLQSVSTTCRSQVEPGAFTTDITNRLRALYAQYFRLTLAPSVLPRLLARSWPVLLQQVTSPPGPVQPRAFFPAKKALQPAGRLHPRGIAGSGLRPLSKIPHCCLP